MTSARKQQFMEAVAALQKSDLPAPLKLDALRAILRPVLPKGHILESLVAGAADPKDSQPSVEQLTATALIMLPLLEEEPPATSQEARIPEDVGRQIETEVRNSLNEKFVRSPAFMLLLAVVGTGVTVFSFGLFTFSSSARRADAVAADFEKRLNDADAKILSSERDLSKRLNGDIDTAMSKISGMQSDSIKTLSADLTKRITEVDAEKDAAMKRIKVLSDQFQQDKNDAAQSVKDQATKVSPRLDAAATDAVTEIQTTTRKNLDEFKRQADQTVAELGKPAIKHVLTESYWFILGALAMSAVAMIFSGITFKWRAHHLKVNGEEPIMRRKTPLSNKKGFSDPICSP